MFEGGYVIYKEVKSSNSLFCSCSGITGFEHGKSYYVHCVNHVDRYMIIGRPDKNIIYFDSDTMKHFEKDRRRNLNLKLKKCTNFVK